MVSGQHLCSGRDAGVGTVSRQFEDPTFSVIHALPFDANRIREGEVC